MWLTYFETVAYFSLTPRTPLAGAQQEKNGLTPTNHPTGGFLYSAIPKTVHGISHSLAIAPASHVRHVLPATETLPNYALGRRLEWVSKSVGLLAGASAEGGEQKGNHVVVVLSLSIYLPIPCFCFLALSLSLSLNEG